MCIGAYLATIQAHLTAASNALAASLPHRPHLCHDVECVPDAALAADVLAVVVVLLGVAVCVHGYYTDNLVLYEQLPVACSPLGM